MHVLPVLVPPLRGLDDGLAETIIFSRNNAAYHAMNMDRPNGALEPVIISIPTDHTSTHIRRPGYTGMQMEEQASSPPKIPSPRCSSPHLKDPSDRAEMFNVLTKISNVSS